MNSTLRQAQAQVNRLKKATGIGCLITVDIVLNFSGFANHTEKDNYHIPLKCTMQEAIKLKCRQDYNDNTIPISD